MKPIIHFVIPAKNEGRSIGAVIQGLKNQCEKNQYHCGQILVVSDSDDDTSARSLEAGATVLEGARRGLGVAMRNGLRNVSKDCTVVVSLDSDGQVDLTEMAKFIEPILQNKADFVVGSRFKESNLLRYQYRMINRFGIFLLVNYLKIFADKNLTDSHGGYRAMTPKLAESLTILGSHTYVQETLVDAARKGFRIFEIPSAWDPRIHGGSRVLKSIPRYIYFTLPILILRAFQRVFIR